MAARFALGGLPNDAHYAFKEVEGFDLIEAYGKFDDFYASGGFRRADELFGRVFSCNSARVYALNRVRLAARAHSGTGALPLILCATESGDAILKRGSVPFLFWSRRERRLGHEIGIGVGRRFCADASSGR
jgi:hypothetical protein